MTQLIAFHGDTKLKAALLAEVAEHRLHDQIIKGTYGEGSNGNWKGCAVGCSLHSLNRKLGTKYKTSDHAAFEPAAGVPVQIAYLQDYIFESLPSPKHIDWPERFWAVIQPGADLTLVTPRFVRWLLEDTLPIVKRTETKAVYERIIALYDRWIGGNKPSAMEWSEVYSAAAAADAARYAAATADTAGYPAAAADTAGYAAAAARYAAAAARHAVFEKQADKLIELLSTAPVLSSANQPESADEQYAGGKPK